MTERHAKGAGIGLMLRTSKASSGRFSKNVLSSSIIVARVQVAQALVIPPESWTARETSRATTFADRRWLTHPQVAISADLRCSRAHFSTPAGLVHPTACARHFTERGRLHLPLAPTVPARRHVGAPMRHQRPATIDRFLQRTIAWQGCYRSRQMPSSRDAFLEMGDRQVRSIAQSVHIDDERRGNAIQGEATQAAKSPQRAGFSDLGMTGWAWHH